MTAKESFTPSGRCLYIVIPAYEPDEKLILLLGSISERVLPGVFTELRILLIDDGSSPDCQSIFDRIRKEYDDCRILVHPSNQGKGAALKTAFSYLIDQADPDDVILLMDADGQHKIEDGMRVAIRCAESPDIQLSTFRTDIQSLEAAGTAGTGEAALYTGSRHFAGKIPLKSRLGNKITRQVFRWVSGIGLEDTQTGLRAFKASLLYQLIRIPGQRYEYEMNMLMQLGRNHIPIVEVPIETIYEKGNPTSHFNPFKDSYRIYKEIFRFWINSARGGRSIWQMIRFGASSFISFIVDYSLYAALILAGVSTAPANVMARTVSASFNFTVNRELVFGDKNHEPVRGSGGSDQSEDSMQDLAASAVRYGLLAIVVLAAGTILLTLLTEQAGIPKLAAKLIVEPVMFLFSYCVQKLFVFRKTRKPVNSGSKGFSPMAM